MNLFTLNEQLELIFNSDECLDENGVLTDEGFRLIESLEIEKDSLFLGLAEQIIGEKTEAQAVKARASELMARAGNHLQRAEQIHQYIQKHLEEGRALRNDKVELKWTNSRSVVIEDEDLIPEEYTRVKVEPDKNLIKKRLGEGKQIQGAHIRKAKLLKVK